MALQRSIPIIPVAVLAACPACFEPEFWRDYLEAALYSFAHGSAVARTRANAGVPPLPCHDCTPDFERRMTAAGRCTRKAMESLKVKRRATTTEAAAAKRADAVSCRVVEAPAWPAPGA